MQTNIELDWAIDETVYNTEQVYSNIIQQLGKKAENSYVKTMKGPSGHPIVNISYNGSRDELFRALVAAEYFKEDDYQDFMEFGDFEKTV